MVNNAKEIITLSPNELTLGMYVTLPSGWLAHPFVLNQFVIKSTTQLGTLLQCDFKQIDVDLDKSQLPANWSPYPEPSKKPCTQSPIESPELPDWNPDTLIPQQLLEALHDKKMASKERSEAVYNHSRGLITRLLETPTAENLKASKKVIGSITDLILSDAQIASNMLRISHHDFYTYTHSVNVGVTSIMLAKALFGNSDAHNMHELGAGFFLHDIGKVFIRPKVLNKPGRLTDNEMRHVRTHPYKGYKILESAGQLSEECRIIILQHHERADGQGYPKQLYNPDIHLYGKICCIADVFDALTAERSYKSAMTPFEALTLMKDKMSDNFDKKLFSEFVNLMR
ncbi:MAG: HD-GYP domain-containing protein (c-di-GMP phosphodiesterase class II) [Motiliproteus sp.]|jgi:HD-GYP domain-containing protein (c-di-GMP phosphodiesterase class II)